MLGSVFAPGRAAKLARMRPFRGSYTPIIAQLMMRDMVKAGRSACPVPKFFGVTDKTDRSAVKKGPRWAILPLVCRRRSRPSSRSKPDF